MNTASITVSTLDELDRALDSFHANRFFPTVAIAFSSPDFPFQACPKVFSEKGIGLVGCTTSGEVWNDQLVAGSLSLLLMDMDPQCFHIARLAHQDVDGYRSGMVLCDLAMENFSHPGILMFVSGVGIAGDRPVDGVREKMPIDLPIYGGLAGDNLCHDATYTFTHEGVNDAGLAALILDAEKIRINGLAVSGWQPLGRVHTVTRSESNIVYEIDGEPALDLFFNYFGDIHCTHSGTKGSFTIAGQYPLQLQQADGSFALRSLLLYDTEQRTLIAAGKVPGGVKFRFCPPPNFSVIEKTISSFQSYAQSQSPPEAVLMISCKGRHTSFGPLLSDEISAVYALWQVPMAGFLSNGEIGNDRIGGTCEFHNVTCSLVTLSEA